MRASPLFGGNGSNQQTRMPVLLGRQKRLPHGAAQADSSSDESSSHSSSSSASAAVSLDEFRVEALRFGGVGDGEQALARRALLLIQLGDLAFDIFQLLLAVAIGAGTGLCGRRLRPLR